MLFTEVAPTGVCAARPPRGCGGEAQGDAGFPFLLPVVPNRDEGPAPAGIMGAMNDSGTAETTDAVSPYAPRVLVVVPTYCEVDSLRPLVERVLASSPRPDVLVVDDNSPDGTGELADRLAEADPRVQVLHRAGKEGLGPAYIAGFHRALDAGGVDQPAYDVIVEMDADGSHQPEQLALLVAAITSGADLAIGARWIPGGRTVHWPWYRKLISRSATAYARMMLRSHLHDITSGYRAFRAPFLASLDLDGLQSAGYAFQIEVAWRAERAGADIREVPITFVERRDGSSKMTTGIAIEAVGQVTRWGFSRRPSRSATDEVAEPLSPPRA